jgi:hypothetical protein
MPKKRNTAKTLKPIAPHNENEFCNVKPSKDDLPTF